VRARYRKSLEHAEMLRPGEVATVEIELYPTANIFKKGHRIRLDVSSSNFPRFDLNPNTGEPLNNNRRVAVAVNTVFLGGVQASEVVLPVMGH
jgi:putative CocE/NonD family hydrolase